MSAQLLPRRPSNRLLLGGGLLVVVVAGLAAVVALVVLLSPFLLAVHHVHGRRVRARAGRRGSAAAIVALVTAVVALYETRDVRMLRGYHLCENPNCRRPIPNTSRAHYCSQACRRYTRIEQEKAELYTDDKDDIPF